MNRFRILQSLYWDLFHKDTTNLLSGLLVKLNMPPSSKRARYLQFPLRGGTARDFWLSEEGLDLAVIPIPPETIGGTQQTRFEEYQILSLERAKDEKIRPGAIVAAICMQPEYTAPLE